MNRIPKSLSLLELSASRASEGAGEIGADIELPAKYATGLASVVHDVFGRPADSGATPPREAILGKQPLYLETKVVHSAARADRKKATAAGRTFVAKAVHNLKNDLGMHWNARWAALGFVNGSLRLPTNPLPVLTLLGAYYRAHAERENAALNLTAEKAEQVKAAIVAMQTAVDRAHDAEKAAKLVRDAAVRKLRLLLGGLREDLHTVLTKDDSRWYRFGFCRPVDGSTPDLVQELTVQASAPTEAIARWTKARLAVNYRVAWKRTGSTDAPRQVGIVSDPRAVITGLPPGADVTVIVTARNVSGESAPTEAGVAVPSWDRTLKIEAEATSTREGDSPLEDRNFV
jgi:hypothetical protein